ncbi:MAG: hypothetical protein V1904_05000 [Bacteroidota bacterium]
MKDLKSRAITVGIANPDERNVLIQFYPDFVGYGFLYFPFPLKNEEKTGDETYIEGNHYDTENDYTLYI